MGIIRWEEPPETEYGSDLVSDIIEELMERADAYALVMENQAPRVARSFAKELEMEDYQIETEVIGGSVYARWRI